MRRWYIKFFFLVSIMCSAAYLLGQNQGTGEVSCDTILIKGNKFIVLEDSLIFIKKDSLIRICKDTKLLTYENGKDFYDYLRKGVEKNRFLLDIYNSVVTTPTIDTMPAAGRVYKAEEKFLPFEGASIRRIYIKRLAPFGTSIKDTLSSKKTGLNRSLNRTHIKTQEWIIRKNLLFKRMDTINPMQLAENARLLSQLPYIEDASISIVNTEADSVDILIITRDKFPFAGYPIIRKVDNFSVYLWNQNFFGLGHTFRNGITYNAETTPNFYWSQLNYHIQNITHFVNGEINYQVSDKSQVYSIYLERALIPTFVRWGGKLMLSDRLEQIVFDPDDANYKEYMFAYKDFDVWSSYLFTLNKLASKDKQTYLIPGTRYAERRYTERPFVAMDSSSRFFNSVYIMTNLVLARQNYDITNYIADFGKIEYFPYGYQARINVGYTWAEYYSSPYLGAGFDITHYIDGVGYLSSTLEMGAHIEKGHLFQGALNTDVYLTSILKPIKSHHIRFFTGLSYSQGINRQTSDRLYLDNEHGIVGLTNYAFAGDQRLSYGLRIVDFTPWNILGFNIATYASFDGGWIAPKETALFGSNMVSGIGIGCYIKNNFLVFDAFQVRFSYYPVTNGNDSHLGFEISLIPLFRQINFLNTRPRMVLFE